ncbi:hypothetical protein BU16DRAFT_560161 [Lophium mytilinum]|uniref:Uncharacterized protein n=1 Tax=Lophium mytilinum TaxID=390894 RepID=A0A6A6QYZ3_9PEZI|nr:hypothetical protein BU16DRAFT_560161 [Lophium mytilinum]
MNAGGSGHPDEKSSDGTPPPASLYPLAGLEEGPGDFDEARMPYFTNTRGLEMNSSTQTNPQIPQQAAPRSGQDMFNDDYQSYAQMDGVRQRHDFAGYTAQGTPSGHYYDGTSTEAFTRVQHGSTLVTNADPFTGGVEHGHGSGQQGRTPLGQVQTPTNEPVGSTLEESVEPSRKVPEEPYSPLYPIPPAYVIARTNFEAIKPQEPRKKRNTGATSVALTRSDQERNTVPFRGAGLGQAGRPVRTSGNTTRSVRLDQPLESGYADTMGGPYAQARDEHANQQQNPFSMAFPGYTPAAVPTSSLFAPTSSPFVLTQPGAAQPGRSGMAGARNELPSVVDVVAGERFDPDREGRIQATQNRYRMLLQLDDNAAPQFLSWGHDVRDAFLSDFPAFLDRHRNARVLQDAGRLAMYEDFARYSAWAGRPIDEEQVWADMERYNLVNIHVETHGPVEPELAAHPDPTPDLEQRRRRDYGAPVHPTSPDIGGIEGTESFLTPIPGPFEPSSASRLVQGQEPTETTQQAPQKSKKDRMVIRNDVLKGRALNEEGMYFNSAEEGNALFRERPLWRPKEETLPSGTDRLRLVRALEDAMYNLEDIHDRPTNRLARWRPDNAYYDPAAVELAAHRLLERIIKLHMEGWTRPVLDPTQENLFEPEPYLSFKERFEAIRQNLQHWKATAKMVLQGDDLKMDQFIAGPNERAERSERYSQANLAKQIFIKEGRQAAKGRKRTAEEAFSSEGRELNESSATQPRRTPRARGRSVPTPRRTSSNTVQGGDGSDLSEVDEDAAPPEEVRDPRSTREYLPRETKKKGGRGGRSH